MRKREMEALTGPSFMGEPAAPHRGSLIAKSQICGSDSICSASPSHCSPLLRPSFTTDRALVTPLASHGCVGRPYTGEVNG